MARTVKKKVEAVIETVSPKTTWQKIKDWFYNSESAFLGWVTGVAGSITAIVTGILSYTDFTSIFTMLQSGLSFTKQQIMIMGIGALGMGVLQYWTRVRGTKEVNGHLLPKAN